MVQHRAIFKYEWRHPCIVTSVNSRNNMSKDDMLHHVLDVHKIVNVSEDGTNSNGQKDEAGSNISGTKASPEVLWRSQRE